MPTDHYRASCFLKQLLADHTTDELRERLRPGLQEPARRVPRDPHLTAEAVDKRWQALPAQHESRAPLLDARTRDEMACYQHNVENFIGCVKLPVGVAGPCFLGFNRSRNSSVVWSASSRFRKQLARWASVGMALLQTGR